MKRHGFSGQPASHGQSLMHRGMGSAGGSQGSGSRVLPGKRMAGRMGNESVTVKNLKVLQVDEENGIVVVNGTCIISFIAISHTERRGGFSDRLKG
jgi:large subunit ribosomal protein L3